MRGRVRGTGPLRRQDTPRRALPRRLRTAARGGMRNFSRDRQRGPCGQAADPDVRQRLPQGVQARTRAAHPRLVHAPGRPLPARVPQGARGSPDAGVLHAARAGHRDHPPAGAAAPRGRGDLLQRHRRPAQGHRPRPGHQARRRPGRRAAHPHPRRPGPAAGPHPRGRLLRHRGRRDAHP
ncbi:hypothetical protein SGPA1_10892 [Streptomyces misionensis JCM 4497]